MIPLSDRHAYHHTNQVIISKKALFENHKNLQAYHPDASICPVLKSNAYGHGLKEVAPLFDSMKCPFLVVNSLSEAYELDGLHVKTPILVMGHIDPMNVSKRSLPFHMAVFDLSLAKALNARRINCNVHIFVDTGMSREGVPIQELPIFLSELKKLRHVRVVGLCSHFADADNPKSSAFVHKQIRVYNHAFRLMREKEFHPKWRHISASGGAFKIHDPLFTMIRAGIVSYGINPLEKADPHRKNITVTPALELHSSLVQIKTIVKGASVGYCRTFRARKTMTIGLLPAGYYEGVDRRLSNLGVVGIRGKFFPIVGRISMNMTTIDITGLPNPSVGETVILYSSHASDPNSIANAAVRIHTIPYDLLVHIPQSIKRVIP